MCKGLQIKFSNFQQQQQRNPTCNSYVNLFVQNLHTHKTNAHFCLSSALFTVVVLNIDFTFRMRTAVRQLLTHVYVLLFLFKA
jgi:hypothetical protein